MKSWEEQRAEIKAKHEQENKELDELLRRAAALEKVLDDLLEEVRKRNKQAKKRSK